MKTLPDRLPVDENLNRLRTMRGMEAACQSANYGELIETIFKDTDVKKEKHFRFDVLQTSALVTAFLLSPQLKAGSGNLTENFHVYHMLVTNAEKLNSVQPLSQFAVPKVDSRPNYVAGKSDGTVMDAKLNTEFNSLVNKWRGETFFISSLGKQFTHPAYVRIMAMGKEGLPLVLRELQNSNDNWFYALKFMAGEDAAAGIENFDDAKAAWLEWGYKHNYI